jgi:hypothetical protein
MKQIKFALLAWVLFFSTHLLAQTPGIIVRPAGSPGPAVLDPNTNGYTSLTTSGFGTNDITNSEIPYKIVKPDHCNFMHPLQELLLVNFSEIQVDRLLLFLMT